ncbi:Winged helix DNA-binding domain-containing protein [Parasphingorhabdus marina DSM 22363]|uniref:Winged helix DNA-binding domain-containing protein n=1 Tax=Parasphingorhabdus marina DSM 22363 TaxID=1123272 RepID=A0A1N6FSJ2_9SPHN|nr:winged helix DNA-binding protein [Parasphingorhabdus marina]SIN98203.1 Winged helix DNA-binding domain-containing protein [Parasphingorhabdus marina DSM 22363]
MTGSGTACRISLSDQSANENPDTALIRSPAEVAETAELLLSIRRIRNAALADILGDVDETSWNILLDIYLSDCLDRPVVTADLSMIYAVPKTTITRYVEYLRELGLVRKERDPANRVRILLSLTDAGQKRIDTALQRIADAISRQAVQ